MKRICFDGDPLFAEIVNLKKIEEILTSLLQQGDVECWFYGSKKTNYGSGYRSYHKNA